MRMHWLYGALLAGLLAALPNVAFGQDTADAKLSPAEKVRKALDQKTAIDFRGNSLEEALEHLRQKTRVTITVDQGLFQQFGMVMPGGFGGGFAGPGAPVANIVQAANDGGNGAGKVILKGDRPRTALQALLGPNGLTYVILGDQVLVTTEEIGVQRQMRQRVGVAADGTPLVKLLQKISAETAVAVVIDPRSAKDALNPVSLNLEDTSLETAVRLAAELAGLKAVRIGDVVLVTDDARAAKINKENEQRANIPASPYATPPVTRIWNGAMIQGGVPMAVPAPAPQPAFRQAPAIIQIAPAQAPVPDKAPPPRPR